jgi:hypothetical protein
VSTDDDPDGHDTSARRVITPQALTLSRAARNFESSFAVAGRRSRPGPVTLPPTFGAVSVADTPLRHFIANAPIATGAARALTTTAAVSQQRPAVVDVPRNLVMTVLRPLVGPGTGSPLHLPVLAAMLAAVRDEIERTGVRRNVIVAPQQTVTRLADPSIQAESTAVDPTVHVLVIGTDGTNLQKILADPNNENFFELMDNGTTAASTIVGHTTISNPSWTTILTGVWGETAGVSNNVFTPSVYDKFPTVFNQLESYDPNIQTTAIADWEVTAAIGRAGSPDTRTYFVPQEPDDTNWLATDDEVGRLSVEAIENTDAGAPSFQFTYFIGVDTNGHMYGADSPEYKTAIENVDDNLGLIMDAVAEREAMGEDWTVIVVTDHGIVGPHTEFDRGHGFQSPEETTTFVIADIAGDTCDGCMNNDYRIVDVTPTVLDLFGVPQKQYFEGVPLSDHSASTTKPVDLHQALNSAIDQYGYPDIVTNVALDLRVIATLVPYLVYEQKQTTHVELTDLANLDIPILSDLAALAMGPADLLFDALYVVTNVPAQIIARLTGVTGASIFPLLPPDWPVFPPLSDMPNQFAPGCGAIAVAPAACIAV